MKHLVEFCLRRPITTLTIHIILIVTGAIAVFHLPLSAQPKSERPLIRVEVNYPNANPAQVEQEVTRLLEEAIATVEGVREIWGESSSDRATVRAEFDWGTDLDQAKLQIRERLARIRNELPIDDIERIRIRGSWGDGDEIIKGRISSTGLDLSQNYELLENRMLRPLERIDGVSQVNMDGVTPLEILVSFRSDDLERHGLQLREVTRRLEGHNVEMTVGEIAEGQRSLRLRVATGLGGIDQVKAFPVNAEGLRLEQVAAVTLEQGSVTFGRRLNGNFAVSIEVFKESTANTVETCRAVMQKIEELRSDPQLKGIDLLVWENQGDQILGALEGLRNAGLIGSLLAMIILILFMKRFSATVLVAMTIPISVLSALAWLYFLGRELNVLTLVALMLGVGMLVDTAVVVVESIARHAAEGKPAHEAARIGTAEVAAPIFAATLTSIVVFTPVFLGEASQINDLLRELGLVITLTLTSSLFVSLTLIPMVAARIYHAGDQIQGFFFPKVRALYSRTLSLALDHRRITLAVTAALVGSVVLPGQLGFKYEFNDVEELEKNVGIFCNTEASVDWRSMKDIVAQVEGAIDPHRERLGIGDTYSWYRDNFAWVAVYPGNEDYRHESMAALEAGVSEVLPKIPGVSVKIGSWRDRHGRGRQAAGQIHLRLFGDSSARIDDILKDLEKRFVGVAGITGFTNAADGDIDEITFRPSPEEMAHHGLTSEDLSRTLRGRFARNFLREIRTDEGETRLRMEVAEKDRDSFDELGDLQIPVAIGELPLSRLGSFEKTRAPRRLRRDERRSVRTVSLAIDPKNPGVARENATTVLDQYPWPRGYGYDFGAGYRRWRQNQGEISYSVWLAIFLVYVVMAFLFESLRQPLTMLITVFLAIPGAIWTLYLTGEAFDLPAACGMILLVGIVVNNGIVLVDHVNRYRSRGFEVHEAILKGGDERLRPILITALTTIIGLLPLALSQAQAAGVYYYTLALVIMGGLGFSTFLTLIVLPVLYSLFAGRRRPGEPVTSP